MKQRLAVMLFALTIVFAFAASASVQTFETMAQCQAWVHTHMEAPPDHPMFYKSRNLDGVGRLPVDGKKRFKFVLPTHGCAHTRTEDGEMHYIAQPQGTVFRGVQENGMFKVEARDDCGNSTDELWWPRGIKGDKGDKGDKGEKGNSAVITLADLDKKMNDVARSIADRDWHPTWWDLHGGEVILVTAAVAILTVLYYACVI